MIDVDNRIITTPFVRSVQLRYGMALPSKQHMIDVPFFVASVCSHTLDKRNIHCFKMRTLSEIVWV